VKNELVVKQYPKVLSSGLVIIDELCVCGRMITEHAGINGHGPSLDGGCLQFTWAKWILEGDVGEEE
tara:strand:+ start:330 stop:530 length:201 start_codon:yes stop_codon:yes gene_type:complete